MSTSYPAHYVLVPFCFAAGAYWTGAPTKNRLRQGSPGLAWGSEDFFFRIPRLLSPFPMRALETSFRQLPALARQHASQTLQQPSQGGGDSKSL